MAVLSQQAMNDSSYYCTARESSCICERSRGAERSVRIEQAASPPPQQLLTFILSSPCFNFHNRNITCTSPCRVSRICFRPASAWFSDPFIQLGEQEHHAPRWEGSLLGFFVTSFLPELHQVHRRQYEVKNSAQYLWKCKVMISRWDVLTPKNNINGLMDSVGVDSGSYFWGSWFWFDLA